MYWIPLAVGAGLFVMVILVWIYLDGARRYDRTMAKYQAQQESDEDKGHQASPCRYRQGA